MRTERRQGTRFCLPCDDNTIVRTHVTQNSIGNVLQLAHSTFAILCEEKGVWFILVLE